VSFLRIPLKGTGYQRLLTFVLIVALLASAFLVATPAEAESGAVKNVIILVGDGMGSAHTTLARWHKGSPLALDEMVSGAVRTYSAESLITDSAPAATAFATGFKSNDKMIGILPSVVAVPGLAPVSPEDHYKPVATLLEGAKLLGKATGLIATSNVQHATPAAFTSHWHDRNDYNEIAKQQVYQQIDVVLGGGKKYLLPKELGGTRQDGLNLLEELKDMGYKIVTNTEELLQVKADKLWGLFADDAMAHDFDRDPAQEPSLAQMTQKAIEILSKDPDGFFLFVEGSQIDWASHANDPIGVISDTLAFDEAVKVALDFAKRDGQTLVVAFSDHGNGGMSIGNKASDHTYTKLSYAQVIEPLRKARLTGKGVEAKLNADRSNIVEVMAQYYGITDLTPEEIEAIRQAKPGSLNYVIGPMLSRRSYIGWTTNGHTGEDLFLYSYGPGKLTGTLENTDIARRVAAAMGLDLARLNQDLFRPVREVFKEANVIWDTSNPHLPKVIIEKGGVRAELPVGTNMIFINGSKQYLPGLVVYSQPRGITYIPTSVTQLLN
jgi:alkaline phosphatase